MISNIELRNFKGHLSTDISFDDSRLHGLVGQNGCGKTSVLQSLQYLDQLADSSVQDVFKDQNAPEFITTRGCNHMSAVIKGIWSPDILSWQFGRDPLQWEASYGFQRGGLRDLKLIVDGKETSYFRSEEE
jgi:predicted ATPase